MRKCSQDPRGLGSEGNRMEPWEELRPTAVASEVLVTGWPLCTEVKGRALISPRRHLPSRACDLAGAAPSPECGSWGRIQVGPQQMPVPAAGGMDAAVPKKGLCGIPQHLLSA